MTVLGAVAIAWLALSVPCALGLGLALRRLDKPPARHLHLVRP